MKGSDFMENKSSKGKTIFIVIIIIVLLGVIGFLFYDKQASQNSTENELKKLQKQITELKKENKELKESDTSDKKENTTNKNSVSTATNNNCAKHIDAIFYGENVGDGFSLKETLKLYSNGTFEDSYESSSGSTGTYSIENGRITLSSPGGAMYDAYTNTYTITDNCTIINKNSDITTLKRK